MALKDTYPIHLVSKTPVDNTRRYSFIYPVDSLVDPRRIVLQHRHSSKDGGGFIGSVGGKYEMYPTILPSGGFLHEFTVHGMLRELFQETRLRPHRFIHRAHYWWANEKQGYCEGEAFFVEVKNLPERYRRLPEGRPINLDARKVVSQRDLLDMQRYILSELLYSQCFYCEEIPFEFTAW